MENKESTRKAAPTSKWKSIAVSAFAVWIVVAVIGAAFTEPQRTLDVNSIHAQDMSAVLDTIVGLFAAVWAFLGGIRNWVREHDLLVAGFFAYLLIESRLSKIQERLTQIQAHLQPSRDW